MSSVLIRNARVYVDRGHFEEALLSVDGIIRAVGSNESVAAQAPADAQIYDARGRLVVPGFNDSHQHLLNTGIALTDIRLQNASGIADVKRIAREYIAKHQPAAGAVLHGMGWNQDYFTDENRLLTRADLDDISTDYPLILSVPAGICSPPIQLLWRLPALTTPLCLLKADRQNVMRTVI